MNSKIIFVVVILCLGSFFTGNYFAKNKSISTPTTTIDTSKAATFAPPKTEKPELKFFVMSFCPYGNQIEDVLRPIVDLIQDKASITPHYIFDKITDLPTYCKGRAGDPEQCALYTKNGYFKDEATCKKTITDNSKLCLDEKSYLKSSNGTLYSSLHGRQEGNQDVREVCAWNQVGDNKKMWWDFIGNVNKNCTSDNADTCWGQQGKAAGLDTNKITECFNKEAFDLIEKEIVLTTQFKVSSSPTVLINDTAFPPETAYSQDGKGTLLIGKKVATQDKYRTPNVIKEAICTAMDKTDKSCDTILNELSGAAPAAGGCN